MGSRGDGHVLLLISAFSSVNDSLCYDGVEREMWQLVHNQTPLAQGRIFILLIGCQPKSQYISILSPSTCWCM
jgi:hypothetical protein